VVILPFSDSDNTDGEYQNISLGKIVDSSSSSARSGQKHEYVSTSFVGVIEARRKYKDFDIFEEAKRIERE